MKLFVIIHNDIKDVSLIKNYFDSTKFNVSYHKYSGGLSEYYKCIKLIKINVNSKIIVFTTTGVGEFIISNKISGIRAALISDEFTSKSVVAHNNVQIAIFPLFFINKKYAIELIKIFLNSVFEGGRHNIRISMLDKLC